MFIPAASRTSASNFKRRPSTTNMPIGGLGGVFHRRALIGNGTKSSNAMANSAIAARHFSMKRSVKLSHSNPLNASVSASNNVDGIVVGAAGAGGRRQSASAQGGIDFPSIVMRLTGGSRRGETARNSVATSLYSPLGSSATEPEFAAGGIWSGRRRAVDISAHKACALLMTKMKERDGTPMWVFLQKNCQNYN